LMPPEGVHTLLYRKFGVEEGDRVRVKLGDGREVEGILMPKHKFSAGDVIILKLDSGYNVGIAVSNVEEMELVEKRPEHPPAKLPKKEVSRELPRVVILGVGGTILSRVDYRTGAVRSAVTAEELLDILPEVAEIADVETKVVMNKYSEHLTAADWERIAAETYRQLTRDDVDGVVILHGTDTLGYTAAALSFALRDLPKPVVLVGSQRSSDRPSSDAALNLISAIYAAGHSPLAHVMVAMHDGTSDDVVALHIGTRVRKNHSSRRDAFQSIDIEPVGYVVNGRELRINWRSYRGRDHDRTPRLMGRFKPTAALVKFYPSMPPSMIEVLAQDGFEAIVIEGTGLGHVGEYLFNAIKGVIDRGIYVFMTTQCIWGRVNMYVYDTGRELISMGVIPLENMLGETALVKAMWALANFPKEDLPKVMLHPFEYEITPRSPTKLSIQ